MTPKSATPAFYLIASLNKQTGDAFYKVEGEQLAKLISGLFVREYATTEAHPSFHYKAAASLSIEERVLLDEALGWLGQYSDPDPGVYDPEPTREMHLLAQYAVRAEKWEEILTSHVHALQTNRNAGNSPRGADSAGTESRPLMPPEEWQNASIILLMLLAQTYYKILESSISMASWFTALDIELNESYFWTVNNIKNLLKDNVALKDFPMQFEPSFPDLYPSTIADVNWQDMVAPDADRFLSTVHQFVHSKGTHDPEEGTPAWIFVEMFRPAIDTAIQRATAYHERMDKARKRLFKPQAQANADKAPPVADEKTKTEEKRFQIALSFPGERRGFIEQVATHLVQSISRHKLLYDKYHEAEFARPDLDTYLQRLYHDESELIVVFLCGEYERKDWCGLEWRSVRDLIKKRKGSNIMFFRFDGAEVPGTFSIDGYIEVGIRPPDGIANCILERMRINAAAPKET